MNSAGLGTPQLGSIAAQPQSSMAGGGSAGATSVNPSIPIGVAPAPWAQPGPGDPNETVRQRSLSVGGNWVGPGGYYDQSGQFHNTGDQPQFDRRGNFISNASPPQQDRRFPAPGPPIGQPPPGGTHIPGPGEPGYVTPLPRIGGLPASTPPVRQPAPRNPGATTGMPGGTPLPPVRQPTATTAPTATTGRPGGATLPPVRQPGTGVSTFPGGPPVGQTNPPVMAGTQPATGARRVRPNGAPLPPVAAGGQMPGPAQGGTNQQAAMKQMILNAMRR